MLIIKKHMQLKSLLYLFISLLIFSLFFSCKDNHTKELSSKSTIQSNHKSKMVMNESNSYSADCFQYDSIIVLYDVNMWSREFKFNVIGTSATLKGRFLGLENERWAPPIQLSDSCLQNILNYLYMFFIKENAPIIVSKEKTNEYWEGEWTQIIIRFYNGISYSERLIDRRPVQDGYIITFSDDFNKFNDYLYHCVKTYREEVNFE